MRDTTLTFPQTLVLRYAHFEPEGRKQPQAGGILLRLVSGPLACRGYSTSELAQQFPPAVSAYWERLQQRPAFQRALAQGVPTTPAPDTRL